METFSHTYLAVFVFREAKVEKDQAIFAGVQGGGMGMVEQNFVRHFRKKLFPVFRDDFNFIVNIKSVFKHD